MSVVKMAEIRPNEVGIVRKKLGSPLPHGKLIALNGEAGWQADIKAPGIHFYSPLLEEIHIVKQIEIPQGEIGLVIANDGLSIPASSGRILGRIVDCDDFQNARAFLENGGEKGQQLGILRSGKYRIHTELFIIITSANAIDYKMKPEQLSVFEVPSDKLGVVTTRDGQPLPKGERAGCEIQGHNKYQNAQVFLDRGGYKGLQEEVLPAGAWNLNSWFAEVELISLTEIPTGAVGVVISDVGKTLLQFNNQLVDQGYKGIWKTPLPSRNHSINIKVMTVIIVPTHEITLEWSKEDKPSSNYDAVLKPLRIRSKDGFEFSIEVTQIIRIPEENAPQMISRVVSEGRVDLAELISDGSMTVRKFSSIKNLVDRVLKHKVSTHLRNSAQDCDALDFLDKRSNRQRHAKDHISLALKDYGVEAIDTLINEIDLPPKLEEILTERTITDQRRDNFRRKALTEKERQEFERQKALADLQRKILEKEFELESLAQQISILGGFQNYLATLKVQNWSKLKLPNILFDSGNGRPGLVDAVSAMVLDSPTAQQSSLALMGSLQHQLPPASSRGSLQLEPSLPRHPIVLLVDNSNSMPRQYLEQLIEGISIFKEELAKDHSARRCAEVEIISLGNSAQVVQPFSYADNFSFYKLELTGLAATGQGIKLALKTIEERKKVYRKQNFQNYHPWIILITGSIPTDDWQSAVQQIKQETQTHQLLFLTYATDERAMDILHQMSSPDIPPKKLESGQFESFFKGLAYMIKKVANSQEKGHWLTELSNALEQAKSSSSPEQLQTLIGHATTLVTEASREKPSRQDYGIYSAELYKAAKAIGQDGETIAKLIPNLTKVLGFNRGEFT